MQGLACSLKELIEAVLRAVLLRNGCTTCQVDGVSIEPGPVHGGNVALASIRGADGRELFRVHDLSDLDGLMATTSLCEYLAKAVRHASGLPA